MYSDRWETWKHERQLQWSRCWDTALGFWNLTRGRESGRGTLLSGGQFDQAVASEKVTEALKGGLSTDGKPCLWSVKRKASSTARVTARAVTKVGVSDPGGM